MLSKSKEPKWSMVYSLSNTKKLLKSYLPSTLDNELMRDSFHSLFSLGRTSYWFLFTYFITFTIGIVEGYYFSQISNVIDTENSKNNLNMYVFIYIGLTIVKNIFEFVIEGYRYNMMNELQKKYKHTQYDKYSDLSYYSKNKTNINEFRRKLMNASSAIADTLMNGISDIVNLLVTLIRCVTIFAVNDLMGTFLILVLINLIGYTTVISRYQVIFFKKRNEGRKIVDKTINLLSHRLPQFRDNYRSSSYIVDLENVVNEKRIDQQIGWKKISTITTLVNTVGLLLICVASTSSSHLMLFVIMNVFWQYISSVSSILRFINWFQQLDFNYNDYQKMYVDKSFTDKLQSIKLPDSLDVCGLRIKQGSIDLQFHTLLNTLIIKKGHNILIQGPSGHGKSSFVLALMGHIPGITLSENSPGNYTKSVVLTDQSITESIPNKTITLREIFNDEKDDNIILECLRVACSEDFLNAFGKDSDIIDGKLSIMDIDISSRWSGGQKARIAKASRDHFANIHNAKISILDEVTSGSDPKVAYQMIRNHLSHYTERTNIVISHLERISTAERWDMIINIENNILSVNNSSTFSLW